MPDPKVDGDTLNADEWNELRQTAGDIFRWNNVDLTQFGTQVNFGFVNPVVDAVDFFGSNGIVFTADSAAPDSWFALYVTVPVPIRRWIARLFTTWPASDPSGEIGSGFGWAGDEAEQTALVHGIGVKSGSTWFQRYMRIEGGAPTVVTESTGSPQGAGFLEVQIEGMPDPGVSPKFVGYESSYDFGGMLTKRALSTGYPPIAWPSPWPTSAMDRVALYFFSVQGASVPVSALVTDFSIREA